MIGGYKVDITKNKFRQLKGALQNRIVAAVEFTGYGVERTAKINSKVLTGRLKSSYGHYTEDLIKPNSEAGPSDAVWDMEENPGFVQLYIGSNVFYAISIEERYHTLLNALTDNERLLVDSMKKFLGEAFKVL